MNRRISRSILPALACLALGFLTACNSGSSPKTNTVTIAATSGSAQSAQVGAAFAAPLAATVTTNGAPTAGVAVTFTAPSTSASGTFTGGTATETDTTNASGVATSSAFTANTVAGAYNVTASAPGASSSASFSLTNTAGAAATISATAGTPQSATISTAFGTALGATVVDSNSNGVAGVVVTFTAPASGASGVFSDSGTNTTTATTNASGVATAAAFTANATTGAYSVTADFSGDTGSAASFSLTNTAVVVTSAYYSFYLTGLEAINSGPNFYALAGSAQIDSTGAVLGGEQDYNNAFTVTSTDTITGGTLTVDPTTGQGTLTLITGNASLGSGGTETLGVQFANSNHALIVQFDGSATSSGSMDTQDLSTAPAGNYAFALSGVDTVYLPVGFGGVFSMSGTALTNGVADVSDGNNGVTTGIPFTGTATVADAYGRGTVTSPELGITFSYYIVGPEVMRLIDIDITDSAVGSAFGQGASAFTNASLGTSVFGVAANSWSFLYATTGMFTTIPGITGTFQGVGDVDEEGAVTSASAIAGVYSIASNGYGSMAFTTALGDVDTFGVYMTDPALNLNDPNNASGGGGALVVDLSSGGFLAGGTGVLVPQTDTTAANFTGNYAFGAQEFNGGASGWEFDLTGQGTVSGLTLGGTGLVSDPFAFFDVTPATYTGVPFAGPATADGANPGRYTIPVLAVTAAGLENDFNVVVYQANGGQLFWMDEDIFSIWLGPLEQQGDLSGMPAARKHVGKTQKKLKK